MKKISISYIITFIAIPLVSQLLGLIPLPAMDGNPSLFAIYSMLISIPAMALSIFAFIMIILACKELTPLNSGFVKQQKLYWIEFILRFVASALVGLVPMLASSLMLRGREGALQIGSVVFTSGSLHYIISTIVLSLFMPLFVLMIERELIRNINVLGRGKAIGHRALLSVWYAKLAFFCVRALLNCLYLYGNVKLSSDSFKAGDDRYYASLSEVQEMLGIPAQIGTIMWVGGLILGVAVTACMIRTTVKLKEKVKVF